MSQAVSLCILLMYLEIANALRITFPTNLCFVSHKVDIGQFFTEMNEIEPTWAPIHIPYYWLACCRPSRMCVGWVCVVIVLLLFSSGLLYKQTLYKKGFAQLQVKLVQKLGRLGKLVRQLWNCGNKPFVKLSCFFPFMKFKLPSASCKKAMSTSLKLHGPPAWPSLPCITVLPVLSWWSHDFSPVHLSPSWEPLMQDGITLTHPFLWRKSRLSLVLLAYFLTRVFVHLLNIHWPCVLC